MDKSPRSNATRVVALILVMSLAAACGSRRSEAELMTAQAGTPSERTATSGPGDSSASDGVDVAGVDVSGVDPGATGPSGGGGDPGGTPAGSAQTTVPGGQGAPAPARSCTGNEKPLVIGAVGTTSGLVGSIIGTSTLAVQAWAKLMNASGGLNCHPVRYLVADDGGDPAKHQALVRQLVERDGVVAFVQNNSVLSGEGAAGYLSEKGIPVVGSEGGSNWYYKHRNYFPVTSSGEGTLEATFAAGAAVAKQRGFNKVATINCIEAAICSSIIGNADRYGAKYGMSVVSKNQASLVQPDFTSACQNAKSAGAQVFMIWMDSGSAQRIGRSCSSVGYKPLIIVTGLGTNTQLTEDPNLEGAYGVISTIPWFETGNPEVAAARAAISKYAPGFPLGPNLMQGWAAARFFEVATKGVSDFTSANILKALANAPATNLGGITNEVKPSPSGTVAKKFCGWLIEIKGGEFKGTGTDPTACGDW